MGGQNSAGHSTTKHLSNGKELGFRKRERRREGVSNFTHSRMVSIPGSPSFSVEVAWEQQRREALFALGHDPEGAAHAAGAPRPAPEEPQGAAFFQEGGRSLRQAAVLFTLHVALHARLFSAIIAMTRRRAVRKRSKKSSGEERS